MIVKASAINKNMITIKYLLTTILLITILSSCKDEFQETPILKGYISEGGDVDYNVKTYCNLTYTNGKLTNSQEKTFIKRYDVQEDLPTLNTKIMYDSTDNYKMIRETSSSSTNGLYPILIYKYVCKKIGEVYQNRYWYEDNNPNNTSTYEFSTILTLNEKNQGIKESDSKTTVTDIKSGAKQEYFYYDYTRFEYNSEGNIIKEFSKKNSTASEKLVGEFVYDSNPNPYKPIAWFFRILGDMSPISESNNNLILSKYYKDGILTTEFAFTYTYDGKTKYPLTVIQSYKRNGNVTSSTKTVLNY
jgi:hypothetical protein